MWYSKSGKLDLTTREFDAAPATLGQQVQFARGGWAETARVPQGTQTKAMNFSAVLIHAVGVVLAVLLLWALYSATKTTSESQRTSHAKGTLHIR
ncbi:MAG: hypothetical protein NTY53_25635 [Kiritimatiellaeota bacterium]|nr:hypothetical protein [Kiritimatiellota bacterium]